ncbi:MAG: hypothetical protein K6E21_01120 [Bacilli bacterium]|nr:hypothetical protein [Bacilli bacterium]
MKALLRILNLVYFLLAGAAIACFSINFIKPEWIPFLRIGFSADITKENSNEIFTDTLLDKYNISRDDLFEDGNIQVSAEVNVTNKMMFNVWSAENADIYVDDEFITPTISSVVSQIEPVFSKVAKDAAKSSIKKMVEYNLKETIGDDKNLYYELSVADPSLSSQTLSDDIESLINELEKDDATLESVNNLYHDIYNKYSTALGNEPKSEEETKAELQEKLDYYNLVDEDGNITSIDEAIAALLGDMLGNNKKDNNEDSSDDEEISSAIVLRRMLNPYYEGEEVTESETNAIVTELKSFIFSKINKSNVSLGFKIAGIVWAVFVLAWAIKLLQCIICLFRKKPYIRVEIIGIFAGIVQVLLALVSGLLILAFKQGFITKMIGLPFIGGVIESIPFIGSSCVGLELTFSALIPGILVLVNLVYSIIYGFVKRSFKRSL